MGIYRYGRGRGRGRGDEKRHYKDMFYDLLQLVRGSCTENIIKEKNGQVLSKPQMRLLLKKSWRYPFANPDRYIHIYIYIVCTKENGLHILI